MITRTTLSANTAPTQTHYKKSKFTPKSSPITTIRAVTTSYYTHPPQKRPNFIFGVYYIPLNSHTKCFSFCLNSFLYLTHKLPLNTISSLTSRLKASIPLSIKRGFLTSQPIQWVIKGGMLKLAGSPKPNPTP